MTDHNAHVLDYRRYLAIIWLRQKNLYILDHGSKPPKWKSGHVTEQEQPTNVKQLRRKT